MILDQIPFTLDLPTLFTHLHIPPGSSHADELQQLAEAAQVIARPKAVMKPVVVEDRTDDAVSLEGITFKSRVLSKNLESSHIVYPYLVTCGMELQQWADGIDDMLANFWAEGIKELALGAAMQALDAYMRQELELGPTASMNPGSLEDWPITEQRPFFAMMRDLQPACGVELTDSMLMVPTKSVSGLFFATEAGYYNCQLCPRQGCPNRRAPYDEMLYSAKYGITRV
jgi:hypothetical protein